MVRDLGVNKPHFRANITILIGNLIVWLVFGMGPWNLLFCQGGFWIILTQNYFVLSTWPHQGIRFLGLWNLLYCQGGFWMILIQNYFVLSNLTTTGNKIFADEFIEYLPRTRNTLSFQVASLLFSFQSSIYFKVNVQSFFHL